MGLCTGLCVAYRLCGIELCVLPIPYTVFRLVYFLLSIHQKHSNCDIITLEKSVDVEMLIVGVRALRRLFVEVGPLASSKRTPTCLAIKKHQVDRHIMSCHSIIHTMSCAET